MARGGILPHSFTATAGVATARESSGAKEVVHILSQIKQHHRNGMVRWHYIVDDANDKTGGLRLNENTVPIADFHLLPKSPMPMPSVMKISVGSFWSLQSSTEPTSIFSKVFHPSNPSILPCYMNLYSKISLEIPSNLPADSAYMETKRVHHHGHGSIFYSDIELEGDVHVKSSIAHVMSVHQDGDIPPGKC